MAADFLLDLPMFRDYTVFSWRGKKERQTIERKERQKCKTLVARYFCRVLKVLAWWGERQTTGSIYTRVNERFRVLVCLLVYVILTWRRASFCLFSVGSSAPLITHWRLILRYIGSVWLRWWSKKWKDNTYLVLT